MHVCVCVCVLLLWWCVVAIYVVKGARGDECQAWPCTSVLCALGSSSCALALLLQPC